MIGLFILHTVVILLLTFVLAKQWTATREKLYWLSFAFHLACGIAVGVVYTYYYSANDTWLLFEDAERLSALAKKDFALYLKVLVDFGDISYAVDLVAYDFRSVIFIKVLSFFSLITGDNYWLCTAYFSMLSFIASWFIFKKVVDHFSQSSPAAALAFLFFPSVVFWSSGIEKETLTLTALYLLSGILLQFFFDKRIGVLAAVIAVFASAVLWTLKYYWAGIFFIAAGSTLAVQQLAPRFWIARKQFAATYLFVFVFVGVAVSFMHPNFYLHRFLDVLIANHDAFVSLSTENNLIHFYKLNPSVTSVVLNAPWALISGILRPFIGEGHGLLGLFASIENFFILLLLVPIIWNYKKHLRQPANVLVLATLCYCVVLCVFLALSTPNFGTLSRYRVGFLPFLVFILAYRNEFFNKLVNKFS